MFFLFFKCSVSCGTGIQVRKIDCIIPALANGSHNLDNSQNGGDGNKEKTDHIESLSDAPGNGLIDESIQILTNEQISMDCDPKLKPIATQSCTTGIECTTIINDNIDGSSHEEADTNTSNENDNAGIDNDNENTNSESDIVDGVDEVNVDQNVYEASVESTNENGEEDIDGNNASAETNAGVESDDSDETEVFFDIQWLVPFYDCF